MNPFMKDKFDKIKEIAISYDSRSSFKMDHPIHYKWLAKYGLIKKAMPHTTRDGKWDYESVIAAAKSCSSREEFYRLYSAASEWAKRNDCFDEICKLIPSKRPPVNEDDVRSEALKCETRYEFFCRFNRSYAWCVRNNKLDEMCGHMKPTSTKWTVDKVRKMAEGFSSRKEFEYKNPNAYRWAIRVGADKEVFSGIDYLPSVSDYDCLYMWSPVGYHNVFKVGVTSERLGTRRIKEVSSRGSLDVDELFMFSVKNARNLEAKILNAGQPFDMNRKFPGSTEFRYYCPESLESCFNMLKPYSRIEEASS